MMTSPDPQLEENLRVLLPIPSSEFPRVASALFAYLFGIINRSQFCEYVEDRELSRAVLKAAKASGYVLMNCKLYAYACWVARAEGRSLPRCSAYGVLSRDGAFLRRLDLTKLGATRFRAFTLPEFQRVMNSIVGSSTLQVYIAKYITKKMTFLMRSYGARREQLEADILSKVIYAAYKQYPRYKSPLHLQNICKTTIHNTGINLIKFYTCAKRQALTKGEDGTFQAVNLPIAEFMALEAADPHPHKEALQSLVALEGRMSEPVREFLSCAAGQHHPGLSQFLGAPNDELVESLPYSQYLAKLRSYFQVSEDQTAKLFLKLRSHLM